MGMVEYKKDNVLVAARKRISFIFDEFDRIIVSVSSGKDSTCLFYLALEEAKKRNKKIYLFFLDQEAEYKSSIILIEKMMQHPLVIPMWYQIPIYMTNATSHKEIFLYAWGPNEKWLREKHELAIHSIKEKYPERFYKFFPWLEKTQKTKTAFLIGLRSKESMNRFRSISSHAGYRGVSWSTKTVSDLVFRLYPIYDWTFNDVWKYIYENNIEYNKIYDKMFAKKGINISTMRISNIIHEKSFRALSTLQEFEPETYNKMLKRIKGIHCAALYIGEEYIFSAKKLPQNFKTWISYRDYLLNSTPSEQREKYIKRFKNQSIDEDTCKHQIKQILINDWENNVPLVKKKKFDYEKWWSIL
jgi:predicted phosphoadenosine phosphosulfate sulfurtransferase